MKKIIMLAPLFLMSLINIVVADSGYMGGYGMMSGGMMNWSWGFGFLWLFWLVVISFVFSVVFWLCYKWLVESNVGKKNRKKR